LQARAKKWKADAAIHDLLVPQVSTFIAAVSDTATLPSPNSKRKMETALAAAHEKVLELQDQVSESRGSVLELSESLAEERRAVAALKKVIIVLQY
jgi:hypothetical protein